MSHALLRRAGYLLSGVAGIALVACAIAGSTDAAAGSAGVAVLGLTVAVFESFRAINSQTRAIEKSLRKLAKPDDRKLTYIAGQLRGVNTAIDQAPSQIVELQRRYDQLATSSHAMPSFGSWAATVPTVMAIVDEVLNNPERKTVLECGSGASTVWVAAAMAHRGDGRVIALEHDASFAEETRRQLKAHGLSQWATVVDARLVEMQVPERPSQPWYDIAAIADLGTVDILFVDGPPGNTSAQARFPAFPLLRHHLAPGSWVVLDDTDRVEERSIRDAWIDLEDGSCGLVVLRVVGRSTFMEVRSKK